MNTDDVEKEVCGANIEVAVAVEIPECDGLRGVPRGKGGLSGGKEGAVPLVEEDADVAAALIANASIEIAVAVEVSEGNGGRV